MCEDEPVSSLLSVDVSDEDCVGSLLIGCWKSRLAAIGSSDFSGDTSGVERQPTETMSSLVPILKCNIFVNTNQRRETALVRISATRY